MEHAHMLWFCSPSVAVSAYVEAFDGLLSGPVAEYITLSQKIGGDVQKHVCKGVPTDQPSNQQVLCLMNCTCVSSAMLTVLYSEFFAGWYDETSFQLSEAVSGDSLPLPETLWCK